mgnify:CR=1 FL=1
MQVVLKDSCYLARITRYRRWFNKSSSEMTGRVRRRSCAPTSPVGGPARLFLSGISFAGAPTSPVGGPAHLLLSVISFAGVPTSPVGGSANLLLSMISSAVAPSSPVGCPAHLLLSEISSLSFLHLPQAVLRASFSPGFRPLSLRHLP